MNLRVLAVTALSIVSLAACTPIGPPVRGSVPSSGAATTTATTSSKAGVGGVAAPANAKPIPAAEDGEFEITAPGVYDGGGKTFNGTIRLSGDGITVQNANVVAGAKYGIYSTGVGNTIRNNTISGLEPTGDGDMNAITFFGDDTKILYNAAIDFVAVDNPKSHTDAVQTWANDPGESSSNVVIEGNRFEGPLDEGDPSFIHQCIMAEGPDSESGGGGGDGSSTDWLVKGNTCTGDMKFDDIDNVTVTGNQFLGADKRAVVVPSTSSGFKFYDDNEVADTYGQVGAEVLTR